jgi:hypothetical protein
MGIALQQNVKIRTIYITINVNIMITRIAAAITTRVQLAQTAMPLLDNVFVNPITIRPQAAVKPTPN